MPRRPRLVKDVAQLAFIAVLVISAVVTGAEVDDLRATFTERVDAVQGEARQARTEAHTNAAAVEAVEALLADVCNTAADRALEREGLDQECTLAEAGNIEEQVPVADPAAETPPPGLTIDTVQGAVNTYLRRYLADLPDAYRDDLRATVSQYLAQHRGPRGERGRPGRTPSQREVAAAVAAFLQSNPPPAGPQGEQGVSVTSTFLDGCDVVFTYSDGTTSRVGPLCGPQGEAGPPGRPPTADEVQAAVDAYCAARADGDCVGPVGPQGPAGPQGQQGPAGPSGRGITSIDCRSTSGSEELTVHYDDGTSETVQCTAEPEPEPEPTPPGQQ